MYCLITATQEIKSYFPSLRYRTIRLNGTFISYIFMSSIASVAQSVPEVGRKCGNVFREHRKATVVWKNSLQGWFYGHGSYGPVI